MNPNCFCFLFGAKGQFTEGHRFKLSFFAGSHEVMQGFLVRAWQHRYYGVLDIKSYEDSDLTRGLAGTFDFDIALSSSKYSNKHAQKNSVFFHTIDQHAILIKMSVELQFTRIECYISINMLSIFRHCQELIAPMRSFLVLLIQHAQWTWHTLQTKKESNTRKDMRVYDL